MIFHPRDMLSLATQRLPDGFRIEYIGDVDGVGSASDLVLCFRIQAGHDQPYATFNVRRSQWGAQPSDVAHEMMIQVKVDAAVEDIRNAIANWERIGQCRSTTSCA